MDLGALRSKSFRVGSNSWSVLMNVCLIRFVTVFFWYGNRKHYMIVSNLGVGEEYDSVRESVDSALSSDLEVLRIRQRLGYKLEFVVLGIVLKHSSTARGSGS